MADEFISVIDVARRLGVRKTTVFKIAKRLGVDTTRRRNTAHGNQEISYLPESAVELIEREYLSRQNAESTTGNESVETKLEVGVFYLVQLEPDHDPMRFKVGFAASMPERLRHLRCSAPFASVIATWPCRRLWEQTAIDCVAAGCERLSREVFRCERLDAVRSKCDQFFALMPEAGSKAP